MKRILLLSALLLAGIAAAHAQLPSVSLKSIDGKTVDTAKLENGGKPFIINDYVDLCLELDTDGIHVGGTDAPVKKVRAAVGPGKIVGASCYGDIELARKATRDGASYVAFGGFYPSRVKKYPVTTPQNIVSDWKKEMPSMPVCVIGGMNVDNATPLVNLGADMVAVVSGVYFQEDPEKVAGQFAALFG